MQSSNVSSGGGGTEKITYIDFVIGASNFAELRVNKGRDMSETFASIEFKMRNA